MNPALLHQTYPQVRPAKPEGNFREQEREFLIPASAAPTHYSAVNRTPQHALRETQLGHSPALPTHAGLDYNSTQLLQHSTYQALPVLLGPPSSLDGNTAGGLTSITSSFAYGDAPRLSAGNANTAGQYVSGSNPYMGLSWGDSNMNDFGSRMRAPTLGQPPSAYGQSSPESTQYINPTHRGIDHYHNAYGGGRPYVGADLHAALFGPKGRSSSFNQLPVPSSYNVATGNNYTGIPSPAPPRPEGPPFEGTVIAHPLVTSRNQTLVPEIRASIQKGFFQVEGNWTCYRRNYFTVMCAFDFPNGHPDGPVYLRREMQAEQVQSFAVSLSAKTATANSQESEVRQLVQHTPKRDKATESVPSRHLVQPGVNLNISGSTPTASISGAPLFSVVPPTSRGLSNVLDTYPASGQASTPASHTFERIQFQKATANNGKRRAQQQYFHIIVELSANVGRPGGEEKWVIVATKQSFPMVVRGRSPGHYKDSIRRDGQAHMDPDRNSRPGGDGVGGGYSIAPLMGPHTTAMDWSGAPGGHGHHYGSSFTSQSQASLSCSSNSSPGLMGTKHGDTSPESIPYNHNMSPYHLEHNDGTGAATAFDRPPTDKDIVDTSPPPHAVPGYYSGRSPEQTTPDTTYAYGGVSHLRKICT